MTREEAVRELKIFSGTTRIRLSANFWEALNTAIKALEQEPCEDCVSRQAVLDAFEEWVNSREDWNEHPVWFARSLVSLPPVTPTRKKGKWIGTYKIGFGEFAEYEVELIDGFVADNCHCSECGEELEKGERGIYCPNCGAKMVEPQESEDKE